MPLIYSEQSWRGSRYRRLATCCLTYVRLLTELVVDVLLDDAALAHALVAQKSELILRL